METQVKFTSENLGSFLSLISLFQCETPTVERRIICLFLIRNKTDKDFIEPEQLAYLNFIIGASQTSDKLDSEVA